MELMPEMFKKLMIQAEKNGITIVQSKEEHIFGDCKKLTEFHLLFGEVHYYYNKKKNLYAIAYGRKPQIYLLGEGYIDEEKFIIAKEKDKRILRNFVEVIDNDSHNVIDVIMKESQ